MNFFTSVSKHGTIATVKFLPAISIIVPFEPVITLKKNLEHNLKNVIGKVEAMLALHYTAEKAIPVIIKLRNLLSGLNYNTHKKSIAIFVSPVIEKVYYFGVEMEEKIVIDPSFTISDLVSYKKEKKEYLILLLSDIYSKMYLGNGKKLTMIKSNKLNAAKDYENDTANFLFRMDQDLSIILKAYALPVFVIGREKFLRYFKKITTNEESLVQFFNSDEEEVSAAELGAAVEHSIFSWKKLKEQYLLQKIEKAKAQNKLSTGVQDIMKAAMYNKGKLLVIEKEFVNHPETSKIYNPFFKIDSVFNEAFFIKDEVDDIIRNVLESGGNVEFIDKGLLENHMHIALVEDNYNYE